MPSIARRDAILAWVALFVVTAALLLVRESLDKTHVALAYLLAILGVGSRGGPVRAVALSIGAFLCFNFFFLPPYYTLTVADPVDWAVLAAFLLTSVAAAQLVVRARREAASAELRAREVERLSALGAETINAARAEDALHAITEVIRTTLVATCCDVRVRDEGQAATTLVARAGVPLARAGSRPLGQASAAAIADWVAANGRAAIELDDGSMRVAEGAGLRDIASTLALPVRTLVLPLQVRGRTVGVLAVMPEGAVALDGARQRFLEALSYYAALGVERRRLAQETDRVEALQKADEIKNAVLASVSHDLRTPLTTIKALAHEIWLAGDDRAATIEEEADRLNRFVTDLLDLSRIAGGALQVSLEINAADDLVGAALQRVSGAMGDRLVVASVDASEPLLLGRFDFVHSLRILSNLIENALKFAPPGSTVEVQARRNGDLLQFVVADRGPGVPSPDRELIFQPFYRRSGSVSPVVAGAGLGLSIARTLAEVQGGTIRCEDRAGGGSQFTFSVPAADAAELEQPELEQPELEQPELEQPALEQPALEQPALEQRVEAAL